MRNGSAWATPPTNVATPVMSPRVGAAPRPVSEPSSDSPSLSPIEMAAPRPAASPTSSAAREPDTYAAAKIGASVEMVPSMSPISAGWTICSCSARGSSARTDWRAWVGDIATQSSNLSGRIPDNVLLLLGTRYGCRHHAHRGAAVRRPPGHHPAAARAPLPPCPGPPRDGRAWIRRPPELDAEPFGGHGLRH